ncbi:MAG: 4'-phosphopantetheinyl transferase superfamily protein [Archangium sp.]|nr:4'-phosphopantetheinyl transferase superfamily protein [Archangium sp.]MDP3572457.1 4'-phosphopantetheinyl transferase superfamily protein [Archangium sp.]
MRPGVPLEPGVVQQVLGAWVLAERREPGEVEVTLGEAERALLAEMPWPLRRCEWLAGRRVAKRLLQQAMGFEPSRTQVLPLESGAPRVSFDGVPRTDLVINLSHTKGWAVAAVAPSRVGIDVCDDVDGERIARIARRVFSEGEAEACGAFASRETQAAVWALKEAGLKLFIGGVFDPGARAIRVESLTPPRVVAQPAMQVALLRLPDAALAVSRDA